MSSESGDKNASGSSTAATNNIRPNRYEEYGNSEATISTLEYVKLKSPTLQTTEFGNLLGQGKQQKGVTLHIKEQPVLGKDYGSLNSILTSQRPKSALSESINSECSLFGVSLQQPLKYSRNALTVKDAMDRRRRSSCSDITTVGRISKTSAKDWPANASVTMAADHLGIKKEM